MSKKKKSVLKKYFESRKTLQDNINEIGSKLELVITYKKNILSCFNNKREALNYIRHRFSNYDEVLRSLPNNSKVEKKLYKTVCKKFYRLIGKIYPELKQVADKMRQGKLKRYPDETVD